MRTASEILNDINNAEWDGEGDKLLSYDQSISAMKQYAKEALQEAAGKVNYPYRDEYGCHCDVPSIILSLIKELK